jgi:hypothetical protein
LLVAAAWPVALRIRAKRAIVTREAAVAATAGLALTLVTALVLALAGALGGPSVWHGSGALETLIVAVAGAAWGWRIAARRRAGVLALLR